LDWGVFHVDRSFLSHWQRFRHAVKQRNAALKSRQPRAVVSAWDHDLVTFGERVTAARAHYLSLLAPHAAAMGRSLLGMDLSMSYRPGWSRDLSFSEALQQSWGHDQETGVTQIGPHRAELGIRLDGAGVKDRISRGQQKLLAATLLMAQLKLFPEGEGIRPSLLLDDPAAELDDERLAGLIGEVSGHALQLIVTTLHGEFSAFGHPGRRFGVAAGSVVAL
jgi:DNA replication and repair protein RecF